MTPLEMIVILVLGLLDIGLVLLLTSATKRASHCRSALLRQNEMWQKNHDELMRTVNSYRDMVRDLQEKVRVLAEEILRRDRQGAE